MFDLLANKFSSIFSRLRGYPTLTESVIQESLEQVKQALLDADVPYALVEEFAKAIHQEVAGKKVQGSLKPDEQLAKVINDRLVDFFGGQEQQQFNIKYPSVVMVLGLQGAGKTTTIAKLVQHIQKDSPQRKILIGSVDFYRPAAIEQLEILSQQINATFYRPVSTQPIRAATELYDYYKSHHYDLLLLDTAGRMHVDSSMLQELQAIDMAIEPNYKILILDSMTGQESLAVAQAFDQAVGFYGAILTKTDSDSRGGAAFAFRFALKKPILFISHGEKNDDLSLFHPQRAVSRMLGMGDIQTLVERANEKIKKEEQDAAYKAFTSGSLTLEDFAKHMDMMGKIGSLSSIMKYLPGVPAQMLSDDAMAKGELQLKKFRAIISSMTRKERLNTAIFNKSRQERVAKGAGVRVQDIQDLLQRFKEMQQYVKIFNNPGLMKRFFR